MVGALPIIGLILAPQTISNSELAYQTVGAILRGEKPVVPQSKTPSKGVFVTIEAEGKVLGCRGALVPSEATLEMEIQKAAYAAAKFDPRYDRSRLLKKSYAVTVTIVERTEPLHAIETLLPTDGLILRARRNGGSTQLGAPGIGVVLPWEGKDPATRLQWAYTKAKTPQGTPVKLERLIAQRFRYPELQ